MGFLIVSATIIAIESIHNIRTPHELPAWWTLIVLAVIIVWKEISFQLVMRRSRQTNSSSLKADAWHHRSDAITSVAAVIGISVALIMGKGYETADDWAALFASVIIVYNGYRIFRPALGEMMDEHTHDELVDAIRQLALSVDGVKDTEKCYIRKTGLKYLVDLHARVDGGISVREGHEIAHELKARLMLDLPQLGNVFIHIEPAK